MTIPLGLCACGCGEPTRISKATVPKRGYLCGQPRRFRPGHHSRTRPVKGYRRRATPLSEETAMHRARAEAVLGRALPSGVIVHHADGTRDVDGPLVICPDRAYHNTLHRRMRVKALGGDPWRDRWCAMGQHVCSVRAFRSCSTRPDGLQTMCRACHDQYRKRRKQEARAYAHEVARLTGIKYVDPCRRRRRIA